VKTNVKAGKITTNHNGTQVRPASVGLKVQTGVKAGFVAKMSKSSPKL
jgi:bifunctional N-acetylglucosamine-1-phosphate-uridyltransferase/glucosamine-1-phosphate-acetyltransferase GlmU-like protein